MFAPGANNRPKSPIDNALGKLWRVVAQSENFVETYESPHLKRLAGSVRPYLKWGKSCTPGVQERPKVAPLTFNGVGRPMKWIETAFQLNITLDHSVIKTRGRAHLTQTTNQHLKIIVKLSSHAPSNHLEHLSNTSHRLPLKEIKGISQDRSVIETWGWARLTRGQQEANPESPQHTLATP